MIKPSLVETGARWSVGSDLERWLGDLSVGAATAVSQALEQDAQYTGSELFTPMARSNSPTRGHPKFPQAGRSDYDDSGLMAMREAASLRR